MRGPFAPLAEGTRAGCVVRPRRVIAAPRELGSRYLGAVPPDASPSLVDVTGVANLLTERMGR